MTPYYQDDWVTIYHGDCRYLLPGLGADAVITDPPYGIGFQYDEHNDAEPGWYELMDEAVPLMLGAAPVAVMPSCAIRRMAWWYANHPPDWLIAWHKGSPGHAAAIGFNDWEPHLVWGKPYKAVHDHFQTVCGFEKNGHPCPKPIQWANWLVSRFCPPGGVLLDPFAGSGTTLVAAKAYGRRAIGIEASRSYCEIAAQRCAQEVLDLGDVA